MAKVKKELHLKQRGSIWWLYYNLPKNLREHPLFKHYPAMYAVSLKTEKLREARDARDLIICKLKLSIVNVDAYALDVKLEALDKEQFYKDNPSLEDDQLYQEVQGIRIDNILDDARETYGVNSSKGHRGHPLFITEEGQYQIDVINGVVPERVVKRDVMLKFLRDKILNEAVLNGLDDKTVYKIKRSVDWLLKHAMVTDINITMIDYDMVSEYVYRDKETGFKTTTISGHLYGLGKIWERAKKSKVVSGDNPFKKHGLTKDSVSYDPFTAEEIRKLYDATPSLELKTLIHVGATTGGRLNELLSAQLKMPSAFHKLCWFIQFQEKGKTEGSTRINPLHSSLDLPEGFTFTLKDRTVFKQFKKLVDTVITEKSNVDTGKPRKLSFHSFRKTVITQLCNKHLISETVVGGLTGHMAGNKGKGSITTYIDTTDLKTLEGLVERLPWL